MTLKTYNLLILIVLGLLISSSIIGLGQVLSDSEFNVTRKSLTLTLKLGLILFIVLYETKNLRPIVWNVNLFIISTLIVGLTLGLMKYHWGIFIFLFCYFLVLINYITLTFQKNNHKLFIILTTMLCTSNFVYFIFKVFNYPGQGIFVLLDLTIMATVFIHLIYRPLTK